MRGISDDEPGTTPRQRATGRTTVVAGLVPDRSSPVDLTDEVAAYELSSRVAATDVSSVTLAGLGQVADRMATTYHTTAPAPLLPEVRKYLGYVLQLVDARMTLVQRRQLLTTGAWRSLLAATVHIDLHQRPAATARLDRAQALAEQVGHTEIGAW